jgi:hypothetical protein
VNIAGRCAEYVGAIVLAAALLWSRPAAAVDQPIAGRRLVMVETGGGGRLLFLSKDAIVAPTPGGLDDPRLAGVTLVLSSGAST